MDLSFVYTLMDTVVSNLMSLRTLLRVEVTCIMETLSHGTVPGGVRESRREVKVRVKFRVSG